MLTPAHAVPEFRAVARRIGSALLIEVQGDLDLSNAGALVQAAAGEAETVKAIVVDFTECSFLDSAGLAGLVNLDANLDVPLVLAVPPGPVRRLLDLVELGDWIACLPNREAALAAVGIEPQRAA